MERMTFCSVMFESSFSWKEASSEASSHLPNKASTFEADAVDIMSSRATKGTEAILGSPVPMTAQTRCSEKTASFDPFVTSCLKGLVSRRAPMVRGRLCETSWRILSAASTPDSEQKTMASSRLTRSITLQCVTHAAVASPRTSAMDLPPSSPDPISSASPVETLFTTPMVESVTFSRAL